MGKYVKKSPDLVRSGLFLSFPFSREFHQRKLLHLLLCFSLSVFFDLPSVVARVIDVDLGFNVVFGGT